MNLLSRSTCSKHTIKRTVSASKVKKEKKCPLRSQRLVCPFMGLCVKILLKVTRSDFMSLKSCIDSTGPCQPVVCVLLSANYCVIISWEWPTMDALILLLQLTTGTSSRMWRHAVLRIRTSKVKWKSPLSPRKSTTLLKFDIEAKPLRVTILCAANNRQTLRMYFRSCSHPLTHSSLCLY